MSQIAQLSKSAAQASASAEVSAAGSARKTATVRASYQPLAQSARASAWSRPMPRAKACICPIGTPKARASGMP